MGDLGGGVALDGDRHLTPPPPTLLGARLGGGRLRSPQSFLGLQMIWGRRHWAPFIWDKV